MFGDYANSEVKLKKSFGETPFKKVGGDVQMGAGSGDKKGDSRMLFN
jgi:hypothetical protein